MFFEGSKEVLARLHEKKQLLAEGNPRHEEIRPALLVCSGVMRGVYGGGQVRALEEFGLSGVFDVAVGISTGAPTVGYFLANQAALGTTIYSEECTSAQFLSVSRFLRGKGPVMDTDYLSRVFRGEVSCKRLAQEAIVQSRTDFFVGVTCGETGEGAFLDAKSVAPDVIEAIHASLVAPGISRGAVVLGGRVWIDGGISLAFPVRKIIANFKPTDLLVLANRSGAPRRTFSLERMFRPLLFAKFPVAVEQVFARRNERFADELRFLREQRETRWAVVWTDKEVGRFERNQHKLEAAAMRSYRHLKNLLAEISATALTS